LSDLAALLPLTEQHPIVVGYRVERQDTWLRKFYSRGYNLLAGALLGTKVRDIDCALKVFRRDALAKLLPESNGFFVNTEMLTLAQQHRLSIAEVGVRHRPRRRGASKVSVTDIPRTLNAMLPFWWMRVLFPGGADTNRERPAGAKRQAGILAFALFVMTCLLFLGRLDHPLLEPEEARYAEIPRQMLIEGRVLTPVLHGEDYWQKPPLLYWLVMLSYQLFGVHDWAARLVPCCAGIATVLLTAWWGWRTLGFWTGLVSGAMLALSMRFLYLAGMLSMDGLLCTLVIAGLACGHLALIDESRRWPWIVLGALACALGILTKGPVALVLVVTPLLALGFFDRRCRRLTMWETCAGLGIVALTAGPWFVFMALSRPAAAADFWWLHNLVRYLAPLDHEKPAWFYAPSLVLGMLPWTLLLVPLVPYLLRKSRRACQRRPAALGAFVLAFAWCVLFFSLSGCKRAGYILPALPLLALILGTFLTHGLPWQRWMEASPALAQRHGHAWARRLATATFGMAAIISIAMALSNLWPWSAASIACLLFAGGGAAVVGAPKKGSASRSWAVCAVSVFLVLGVAQRFWLPEYHERFGLRRQVEISSEYEQEEDLPILSYPKRWDSIGFYTKREVESHPARELAQLVYDLERCGKALVFIRRDESLQNLANALPPHLEIELLGRDEDFVVIGVVRPRQK
jgi:dolichol-phosphate mannosyltransferase